MRAWNAQFERIIWREIMVKRYGWPEVPLEHWYDTAADAAAMGLPRALGACADVLGLAEQKQSDFDGGNLALRMCRPRSTKGGEVVWWNVPDRLERLYTYAMQDVRVERAVYRATRRLDPSERQVYLLDQRMNDRGILLDRPLVLAAKELARQAIVQTNAELKQLTAGTLTSVTDAAAIRRWLGQELFEDAPGAVDSIRKSVIQELLAEEAHTLPPDVRAVVEARQEAGRTSIKKLDTMLATAGADDVIRGTLLYHGASTGRWAGKGIQPQNFPRPEYTQDEIDALLPLVLRRDYHGLNLHRPVLPYLSFALRAMLRARPGHRLLVGDFAQIEARVLAWLYDEQWLLKAFANGEPIYERMAAVIYRVPASEITKKDPRRKMGKDTELGCGYGMGWETFITQAWERANVRVPEELAKRAVEAYRETHPAIRNGWFAVDGLAMAAVRNPEQVFSYPDPAVPGRPTIRFVQRGGYLWVILPTGRPLAFAKPRIRERETPWGEVREAVICEGVDSYTHRWHPYALYGGLITENIVQAMARDIMAGAMLRLEQGGYGTPVLTVHDEVVADTPLGVGSLEEFRRLMARPPRWAATCPIDVDCWEGERYGKR